MQQQQQVLFPSLGLQQLSKNFVKHLLQRFPRQSLKPHLPSLQIAQSHLPSLQLQIQPQQSHILSLKPQPQKSNLASLQPQKSPQPQEQYVFF